jgi:type III secretion protein R
MTPEIGNSLSNFAPNITGVVVATMGAGMIGFAVVTMTPFVKLSTILMLLRTAMGTQQTPPNIVLYGIALLLSLYIMAPIINQSYLDATVPDAKFQTMADYEVATTRVLGPVRTFMLRFSSPGEREFFANATQRVWGPNARLAVSPDDTLIVIPAFLLSELRRSFEAGFLLYLPFIAVDLVMSTVLLAMGMSSVSPTTLSVPFKLFLFVAIEGWTRLFHGLVLGYAS